LIILLLLEAAAALTMEAAALVDILHYQAL
jgi:hypothetical protein